MFYFSFSARSKFTDECLQIKKLVQEGNLQSYQVFHITAATKELDSKLEATLSEISLDVQGKLVQVLPTRAVFKLFEATFNVYINEWVENCDVNGRCTWFSKFWDSRYSSHI